MTDDTTDLGDDAGAARPDGADGAGGDAVDGAGSVTEPAGRRPGTSRRRLFGTALGAVGAVAAGGAGFGIARATESSPTNAGTREVPYYGAYQAGIATPAQDRLAFAADDARLVGGRGRTDDQGPRARGGRREPELAAGRHR
jgi:hypothetical protein